MIIAVTLATCLVVVTFSLISIADTLREILQELKNK